MNRRSGIVVGILCALAAAGCARKAAPPAEPVVTKSATSTPTGGSRRQEIKTTAIVQSVDVANRTITLKRSNGEVATVGVGDNVRNLPQVKRGDRVVVTHYDSIGFEVLQGGKHKPSLDTDDDVFLAPLGQRPHGGAERSTTLVAKIVKLDRENRKATLRGPKGKLITVDVENPENFDKVKVGDSVEVTEIKGYAIDVQPAR